MLKENEIYLGDCLDIMKNIPDKSIDLVLTDPPYNASNSNIKLGNYNTINQEWDKNFNIYDYLDIIFRKLKPNGQAMFFCSYHILGDYLNYKKEKLQQIIHWKHITFLPAIAKIYSPVIEYIVWYSRKGYYFNKRKAKTNVIENLKSHQEDGKINHPSVKPINLLCTLLQVHSNENYIIFDPFAGSGTTALACIELNRRFICVEKDVDYYNIARKRIEDAKSQLRLF